MTKHNIAGSPLSQDLPGLESFQVTSFTEHSNPRRALRVQRIHAADYVDSGYVSIGAVVDQVLTPDIDTARGSGVIYYLGIDPVTGDEASLRKKAIPEGGGLEGLPNFRSSQGAFYSESEEYLRDRIRVHGAGAVVEICALSRSNPRNSLASLALVRALVHESSAREDSEDWFILFAKPAFLSFRRRFGEAVVRRAGHDLTMADSSGFIKPGLQFVPTIIQPATTIETLDSEGKKDSGRRGNVLGQTLRFMQVPSRVDKIEAEVVA